MHIERTKMMRNVLKLDRSATPALTPIVLSVSCVNAILHKKYKLFFVWLFFSVCKEKERKATNRFNDAEVLPGSGSTDVSITIRYQYVLRLREEKLSRETIIYFQNALHEARIIAILRASQREVHWFVVHIQTCKYTKLF